MFLCIFFIRIFSHFYRGWCCLQAARSFSSSPKVLLSRVIVDASFPSLLHNFYIHHYQSFTPYSSFLISCPYHFNILPCTFLDISTFDNKLFCVKHWSNKASYFVLNHHHSKERYLFAKPTHLKISQIRIFGNWILETIIIFDPCWYSSTCLQRTLWSRDTCCVGTV